MTSKLWLLLALVQTSLMADVLEPPPDIHVQTMGDYVIGQQLSNDEMKLRSSVYLDSLKAELERLALEMENVLHGLEDFDTDFRRVHMSFLDLAENWASFCEAVQWYDLSTGEPAWGSGMGYTYIQIYSAMVWDRILMYRSMLEEAERYGHVEPVHITDIHKIGGS
ncbi:MAG: hypothetical protein GF388_02720 [Candidatus Aegiribacteria sp.]|nr:hypothetical protein [Candidatus Aegiribacteria sp.]MBD3294209.1 hypothetical protein [Candidatus Fermentibacteria bacterium]